MPKAKREGEDRREQQKGTTEGDIQDKMQAGGQDRHQTETQQGAEAGGGGPVLHAGHDRKVLQVEGGTIARVLSDRTVHVGHSRLHHPPSTSSVM